MERVPKHAESTGTGSFDGSAAYKAAVTGAALLWALAVVLVFFWVPEIQGLGPDAKIFFFHVPSAWLMLLSAIVAGSAAAGSLASGRRSPSAGPAMELAALFGLVVMVTGPLWAWRAWGRPWVWEPRLTTSLVCWLTFLAAAGLNASRSRARKRTAEVVALMGALEVPLVYLSVRWWQGAHHPPQTLVLDLHGRLAAGLLAATAAATALWSLLFFEGRRLVLAEDRIARTEAVLRPRRGATAAAVLVSALALHQGASAGPPPLDSDAPAPQTAARVVDVRPAGPDTTRRSQIPPRGAARPKGARPRAGSPDGGKGVSTGRPVQGSNGTDQGFRPYETRPERAPARGYAAVVAAYLALWAIVFLYLLRLARSRKALESRLTALEQVAQAADGSSRTEQSASRGRGPSAPRTDHRDEGGHQG